MICAAPNSELPTPNIILTEPLTVDADAHLQKLTAHMFPSPALLPVELVRSALKRKAAAVSVYVRPGRIVICDNGSGIGSAEWQALACLGDSGQSAAAREKAIALIQGLAQPGIGLLAVFLPGVRSLQIENAGTSGESTLRMTAGRVVLQNNSSWHRGTRISITRRRGPAAEEKVLLAELCAAARAEIVINGRQLKKKPLLPHSMASMNIIPGENSNRSLLAIPAQGDACRIWLLEQGIPWQVTATAPVQGMIFTAALETNNQIVPPFLETLAAAANRLYQWLAENYPQFPESYQSRIEDLLFKQVRSGHDAGLLSICAPFRLYHSPRRLNLDEVRYKAASGNLYFMDYDSRPSHGNGQEMDVLSCEDRPIGSARIGGRSVLLLTVQQKDFLFNYLRLPMVNLNAQQKTKIKPRNILIFCRDKFAGFIRWLAPAKASITDRRRLRCEENNLCRELEIHWRRQLAALAPDAAVWPISVVLAEGRGLAPAYRLKNEQGNILLLRRRHPLVLRALQSIGQDGDNSELAFAALMPGHFLTDTD
ncbi:MAG: hypothetical protein WCL37_04405 [Chrysiogenales bacterium]